jgi:Ca-activated chloride channel family protein
VGLTTIGVGNNFNLELMQGLAESGSGNFYYLENPAAVNEVFTEELAYFAEAIALGLEITVQSAGSHQIGEVIGSKLWQAGQADEIDGGVHSGSLSVAGLFLASRVDTEPTENGRRGGGSSIYLALERIEGVAVGNSIATVTASFRLPGSDEVITQEIDVVNAVGDELPEGGYVSHLEMLKAYAVYNFFVGLRQACQEAQIDRSQALDTVVDLQERALAWNTRVPDADISDDLDILARFEANLGGRPYDYGDEPYEGGYEDEVIDNDPQLRMCSTSGGGLGSLAFAFLLLACLIRFRRR